MWRKLFELNLANGKKYLTFLLVVTLSTILLWKIYQINPTGFDKPKALHIDEVVFARAGSFMAFNNDLNPHWFGHPASTQIYPLAAIYTWKMLQEGHKRPSIHDYVNDERFMFSGEVRWFGYLTLLGAALTAFFFCKRQTDAGAGFLAVFFTFLTHQVIHYGPMIRNDGTSILCTTLALTAISWSAGSNSRRRHFLAGMAIGMAFVTKFYLGFVGVIYICDLLMSKFNLTTFSRSVGFVFFGFLAGAFCFAPFLFLSYDEAFYWLKLQVEWTSPSQPLLPPFEQLLFFLKKIYQNWGVIGLGVVAVGFVDQFKKKERKIIGYVVGSAIFLGLISSTNAYYDRWIIPLFPVLALFFAHGIKTTGELLLLLVRKRPVLKTYKDSISISDQGSM